MPTPYAGLLLGILHKDPARPAPGVLMALTPEEWGALTQEAIRYRLAFEVSAYLKNHARVHAQVPEVNLQRLNASVRQILMHNMARQVQLRNLLIACATAGIPVMLMKGLWLVEIIYRDLKTRNSGDIDLLLRPEDMPAFTRLAQAQGFEIPREIRDIRDIAATNNEFTLIDRRTGANFDIHWSLTHPEEAPIDEDSVWRRAETVTVAETPCLSPNLEDHFLLICFHASLHHQFHYVGPRLLVDIAKLITQPPRPIGWRDFLERAHELGWSQGVWLTLDLVRESLGVQPPGWVLDQLRPDHADNPDIHQAALNALFMDQGGSQTLGQNVVNLMTAETWRERLALVLRRLFPPRQYIASYFKVETSHPGLHWLYLKRWRLMFNERGPRLLNLWLNDPQRRTELIRTRIIANWLQGTGKT